MKRILLIMTAFALVLAGCDKAEQPSEQPKQEEQDPGVQNPVDNDPDVEPDDTRTVLQRTQDECRANRDAHKNCACIIDKKSLECICQGDGAEKHPECGCLKAPGLSICACLEDPSSNDCYCSKEENAGDPACGKSPLVFCDDFCTSRADLNELQSNQKYLDADCDYDGLSNEEELGLGTDLCNEDSDGDDLSDSYEVREFKSDPLSDDTDGDGLLDEVEDKFGLNPNGETIAGKSDSQLWVTIGCDIVKDNASKSPLAALVDSGVGKFQFALPPAVVGKSMQLNAQDSLASLAIFDDTPFSISGAVFTMSAIGAAPGNGDVTDAVSAINAARDKLASTPFVRIEEDFVGGAAETHDKYEFAKAQFVIGTYRYKNSQWVQHPYSVGALRRELLFRLSSINQTEITNSNFPQVSNTTYQKFSIHITAVYREKSKQIVYIFTALPLEIAKGVNTRPLFRTEDLTNTTALGLEEARVEQTCQTFKTNVKKPTADFYFVLDESGSMVGENKVLKKVSLNFWKHLSSTYIDYRVGVTNITENQIIQRSKALAGVVISEWTNKQDDFNRAVDIIINAGGDGEQGLEIGQRGINAMLSGKQKAGFNIRKDTTLITTWMTDEGEYKVGSKLPGFIDFYKKHTTGFAIVSPGAATQDYRTVAQATGGAYSELVDVGQNASEAVVAEKAEKATPTILKIIEAAAGKTSPFELTITPISSTLQVYKTKGDDRRFLERSRVNGYDYDPQSNSLTFYGDAAPNDSETDDGGRYLIYFQFYSGGGKDRP